MTLRESTNAVLYNSCQYILKAVQLIVYYVADIFRPQLKQFFKKAWQTSGIELGGNEEYDIRVNDEKAFAMLVAYGTTGFFECFVEQYLEADDVQQMLDRLFKWKFYWLQIKCDIWSHIDGFLNKTFDIQTIQNSVKDGGNHYDLFGESIKMYSGPLSLHSCVNFDNTSDFAEAEIDQLKLLASKLNLKPGMKILDIGCGFGTLAEYLAKNFDVSVTGVTISEKMAQTARERCAKLDVNIIVCDYREMPLSKYDRITCIEMMEHIGEQHHSRFFEIVHEHLKDDGIFLLQIVSNNQPYMYEYNPLFAKFLGMRITFPQIQKTIQKACDYFVLEQLQNQGYNYGLTLAASCAIFIKLAPALKEQLGERFYRIFSMYGAGGTAFKNRQMHNFLIVFSKSGLNYSYSKIQ